jgi:hypothetical protein
MAQDFPCEFAATAPPTVIDGYPGIWGIHNLYLKVKFNNSIKVNPASTVINFSVLLNSKILLNFLILTYTLLLEKPNGL